MYIDKIINLFFSNIGVDFLPLCMAFLIIIAILVALIRPIDI